MTKIRAALKRIHSPDIPNLNTFSPDRPNVFVFLLQAMFGPEDDDGEESFDIIVCTPSWLQEEMSSPVYSGRHHLIVQDYIIKALHNFLTDRARECEGYTWSEVAGKLGRIGKWEFEDYEP